MSCPYTATTSTPRACSRYVQLVADGNGVFTAELSSSDGSVASIASGGDIPDGVAGITFAFPCERILYAHGAIINTSPGTAGMTLVSGTQFPNGIADDGGPATIFMAVVDHATGLPALPPAGTVVQCRFDFQMHPEY